MISRGDRVIRTDDTWSSGLCTRCPNRVTPKDAIFKIIIRGSVSCVGEYEGVRYGLALTNLRKVKEVKIIEED